MQPKFTQRAAAAAAIEHYFETPANYVHANNVAALVLESYGADHAWLKPETISDPEPDDALYWPTQRGRDLCAFWRAHEACFGRPWPTVAEAKR